ncbi:MAG: ATPase domain-containing protein, partial [Bacillota bacterium]
TRRLRIVKYRGSLHGTNEFPFLIDAEGISLLPVTSLRLNHETSTERVSSGIAGLDAMMGGQAFHRGSSILVSGTAGAGKTSIAAHFIDAGWRRGERCLWLAYEESPRQIIRNMNSIGIDLDAAQRQGLLRFHAERPTFCGLEMHLLMAHKLVNEFRPQLVVIDPVTGFGPLGSHNDVKAMLIALLDLFKTHGITALFTSLTAGGAPLESTDAGISSLMDIWLLLRAVEFGAERNRLLHVLKARGIAHSNQVREFLLTKHGIVLKEVYTGSSGSLLTGTMRALQEARERAHAVSREQARGARQRLLERRQAAAQARIAALQAELAVRQAEAETMIAQNIAHANAVEDKCVETMGQGSDVAAQTARRRS